MVVTPNKATSFAGNVKRCLFFSSFRIFLHLQHLGFIQVFTRHRQRFTAPSALAAENNPLVRSFSFIVIIIQI